MALLIDAGAVEISIVYFYEGMQSPKTKLLWQTWIAGSALDTGNTKSVTPFQLDELRTAPVQCKLMEMNGGIV